MSLKSVGKINPYNLRCNTSCHVMFYLLFFFDYLLVIQAILTVAEKRRRDLDKRCFPNTFYTDKNGQAVQRAVSMSVS